MILAFPLLIRSLFGLTRTPSFFMVCVFVFCALVDHHHTISFDPGKHEFGSFFASDGVAYIDSCPTTSEFLSFGTILLPFYFLMAHIISVVVMSVLWMSFVINFIHYGCRGSIFHTYDWKLHVGYPEHWLILTEFRFDPVFWVNLIYFPAYFPRARRPHGIQRRTTSQLTTT